MVGETEFGRLAVRLAAGDGVERDEAAAELLSRYAARLVALARRNMSARLLVKDDPEDVLQSALRTFFRRLDAGQIELRGWGELWELLALMTLRKCRRNFTYYSAGCRDIEREVSGGTGLNGERREMIVPDREPTPDEVAIFNEELERLLAGFDEQGRLTVELLMAGEEGAVIARRLGCSQRTVRRIRSHAKRRLTPRSEE